MPAAMDNPILTFADNPPVAERLEYLLAGMMSGWPRRGRLLLALSAGRAPFLESLWLAGFDLTVHDNDPEALAVAAGTLKNRAERILGAPEHLPVDDCSFDYALALPGPETPLPELLRELHRVACRGVLLLFASSWSLAALEYRLRNKAHPQTAGFFSPRKIRREARLVFGTARRTWGSVLPGHSRTWKPGFLFEHLNAPLLPLPLGAVASLRLDRCVPYTGTPLMVRAAAPVISAE